MIFVISVLTVSAALSCLDIEPGISYNFPVLLYIVGEQENSLSFLSHTKEASGGRLRSRNECEV